MATQNGYPLNTTIDISCMNGFRLKGQKHYKCIEKENSIASWNSEINVNCVPETTKPTTIVTTTTSTSTTHYFDKNYSLEDDIDPESYAKKTSKSHVYYESCKIDSSSMLLSFSNLINSPLQLFNEFIFKNASVGSFIEHDSTAAYHCAGNSNANYIAKCLNGTLFMQQNCNEVNSGKVFKIETSKIFFIEEVSFIKT
jgi:hypothetical protein